MITRVRERIRQRPVDAHNAAPDKACDEGRRRRPSHAAWLGLAVLLAIMVLLSGGRTAFADNGSADGPQPNIVGGGFALPGQFPSIVHYTIDVGDGWVSSCGGSLVAPSWVLTAAHCVYDENHVLYAPSRYQVVLGRTNLAQAGGEVIGVTQVVPHPAQASQQGPIPNDLALLRLERPSAQPVQRLVTSADASLWTPGKTATVAGWGATRGDGSGNTTRLKYVNLTIRSDADCAALIGRFGLGIAPSLEVCAGGVSGQSSCFGDSGGPLMVRQSASGPWIQIGVVSWGTKPCAQRNGPSVYAELAAMRAFVDSVIGSSGGTAPPAPTNVRRGIVTRTSFQLLWTDRATNEDRYEVAAGLWSAETWPIFRFPKNIQGMTAIGARPNTQYGASVRACNANGCSAWSADIPFTTLRSPVGSAPTAGSTAPSDGLTVVGSIGSGGARNRDAAAAPVGSADVEAGEP